MALENDRHVDWVYQGRNSGGNITTGIISAPNIHVARLRLLKQRITPETIRRYTWWERIKSKVRQVFSKGIHDVKNKIYSENDNLIIVERMYCKQNNFSLKTISQIWKNPRVTKRQINLLMKKFTLLIKSGVPILKAFDILINMQNNKKMIPILSNIRSNIEAGISLSEAFSNHPRIFDSLLINFLIIGEKGGILDELLQRYVNYQEKNLALWRKVRTALTYPILIFVISMLILAGVLSFVVPQFSLIYAGFGAQLPMATILIMNLSDIVIEYWLWTIITIGGLLILGKIGYSQIARLRLVLDKLILQLPIIGKLMRNGIIVKFNRSLALLFGAGVPLNEALSLNVKLVNNYFYALKVLVIKKDIESGESLSKTIINNKVFGYMTGQMISIGEETGRLEMTLITVADYYEQELETSIEIILSMIEPLTIILLGGLLGAIIIALYLPLFNLGNIIG